MIKMNKSIIIFFLLVNYIGCAFAAYEECGREDDVVYTIYNETGSTLTFNYFYNYNSVSKDVDPSIWTVSSGQSYNMETCGSGSNGNIRIRLAISAGPYVFILSHDREATNGDEPNFLPNFASNAMNNYLIAYKRWDNGSTHNGTVNWMVYGMSGGPNQPKITYNEVGKDDDNSDCPAGTDICASYNISSCLDYGGCEVRATYWINSVPTVFTAPLGTGGTYGN